MAIRQYREELNSIIRDVSVAIESFEQQHQENKKVLMKYVQDGQCCVKNARTKNNTERMKRPLSTILAEEAKPVLVRSSRSAAKAAVARIKTVMEDENGNNNTKRRCIVKLERLSVAPSVLDIIAEEQEMTDSSPEILLHVIEESPLVNQVYCNSVPNSSVRREENALEAREDVTCAAGGCSSANTIFNSENTKTIESPSDDLHTLGFSSKNVANSTFVFDGSLSKSHTLPDANDKKKGDDALSSKDSPELSSTFVISTHSPDADIMGEKHLHESPCLPTSGNLKNAKESKKALSHMKLHAEKPIVRDEDNYVDLEKLIRESPVRVTRTKTRALAQAAAAAAASTNIQEPVKSALLENIKYTKLSKKKTKMDNKKEVSGLTNNLYSPPFIKSSKMTPEDMKENYHTSAEKIVKANIKDLNSTSRPKAPLSSNNSQASCIVQSSKLNAMGMGSVVAHCDSFITKNATKPALANINQKILEDRKHQEEKVIEAEKKRDRILKEKAEQQKRNNEARAAKVAKTREQLERQRAIQQQQQEREKEHRLRTALQKREEEMAHKRQIAQQRLLEAEERRKQEEELHLQALRKREQEEAEKRAIQLKKEAEEQSKMKLAEKSKKEPQIKPIASGNKTVPQVPANVFGMNDIYSGEESDDEEVSMKKVYPSWTKANRYHMQLLYQEVSSALLAQFFQAKQHTPDLIKIFGTVPQKALVRSSSAVWHTPPSASMSSN